MAEKKIGNISGKINPTGTITGTVLKGGSLSGSVGKEIEIAYYTGAETETAKTYTDNKNKVIYVDVKKVPNSLKIDDRQQVFVEEPSGEKYGIIHTYDGSVQENIVLSNYKIGQISDREYCLLKDGEPYGDTLIIPEDKALSAVHLVFLHDEPYLKFTFANSADIVWCSLEQLGLNEIKADIAKIKTDVSKLFTDLADEAARAQNAELAEELRAIAAENALGQRIDNLDFEQLDFNANETLLSIKQVDGTITAVKQAIQINKNQVNNLVQDLSDLNTAIGAEEARAELAESGLRSDLDAEIARATAAEASGVVEAKSYADTQVGIEQAARINADSALDQRLVVEESGRRAADKEINDRIDGLNLAEVGQAGSYIKTISEESGQVSATAQAFDTTLENATNSNAPTTKAVSDAITAEETSRETADSLLEGLIEAEESGRIAADTNLQSQIDNLKARGRYLSLWDASTGLPADDPETLPYEYKAGDYFIIGEIADESGEVNYRPEGVEYTGDPSTVLETEDIAVDDVYYFDGENWAIQFNTRKNIRIENVIGLPEALDSKADDDSVVHKTGNEVISGNKAFEQITVYGEDESGLPTGSHLAYNQDGFLTLEEPHAAGRLVVDVYSKNDDESGITTYIKTSLPNYSAAQAGKVLGIDRTGTPVWKVASTTITDYTGELPPLTEENKNEAVRLDGETVYTAVWIDGEPQTTEYKFMFSRTNVAVTSPEIENQNYVDDIYCHTGYATAFPVYGELYTPYRIGDGNSVGTVEFEVSGLDNETEVWAIFTNYFLFDSTRNTFSTSEATIVITKPDNTQETIVLPFYGKRIRPDAYEYKLTQVGTYTVETNAADEKFYFEGIKVTTTKDIKEWRPLAQQDYVNQQLQVAANTIQYVINEVSTMAALSDYIGTLPEITEENNTQIARLNGNSVYTAEYHEESGELVASWHELARKDDLANVAFSGDYDDLSNTPPEVSGTAADNYWTSLTIGNETHNIGSGGGSADFDVINNIEDLGNERYKFPKDILPLVYYCDDVGLNLYFDYTINKIRDDQGLIIDNIEIDHNNNQVIMNLYNTAPALDPERDTVDYMISNKGPMTDIGSYANQNAWKLYHGDIFEIYYWQLKNLRDNKSLIPGQKYKIMDFVTTTKSSSSFRSAGHAFYLIVEAIAADVLSPDAKALPHPDDTYFNKVEQRVVSADWIDPDMAPSDVHVLYNCDEAQEYLGERDDSYTCAGIYELGKMENEEGDEVPALLNPDTYSSGGWGNDVIQVYYQLNGSTPRTHPYHFELYERVIVKIGYENGVAFFWDSDPQGVSYANIEYLDGAEKFEWKGKFTHPSTGVVYDKWLKWTLGNSGWYSYAYYLTNEVTDANGQFTITQQQVTEGLYYDYVESSGDIWYVFKGFVNIDGDTLDLWQEYNPASDEWSDQYFHITNHIVEAQTEPVVISQAHLENWEIKYCLDNDTNKFEWADGSNGKGVIYYMKDEFGNECPYDFKNIQYYITGMNSIPYAIRSTNSWLYTFSYAKSSATLGTVMADASIVCDADNDNYCMGNVIKGNLSVGNGNEYYLLPYSIFFQNINNADSNFRLFNNFIGDNVYNAIFKYDYSLSGINIESNCSNIFFGEVYNLNIGSGCYNIGVSSSHYSYALPTNMNNISIGLGCNSIYLGSNYSNITIGNNCFNVEFNSGSSSPYSRQFMDYVRNITIDPGTKWIFVYCNTTNTNYVQNYYIHSFTTGTNWNSSKKILLDRTSGNAVLPTEVVQDGASTIVV